MKKVIGTTILIVVLLIMLTVPAYALSFNVKLTPSQKTVSPGNEVIVTVSTNNLNIGGNGMNAFMCTLNYDTNVFETVQETDITGLNGWGVMYYSSNNRILADLNDVSSGGFIQQDAEIFKIKFKVKEATTSEAGTIQIQNPTTSNGRIDVTGTTGSLTISLKALTSTTYEIGENNEIANVPVGTTPSTLVSNITGGQNLTVKDSEGNPITTGNVGTGAIVETASGEQYTVIVKGDVNGDGVFDIIDLSQVVYHIVEKSRLQGEYEKAADIDGNGRVDIIDLSNLVLVLVGKATL